MSVRLAENNVKKTYRQINRKACSAEIIIIRCRLFCIAKMKRVTLSQKASLYLFSSLSSSMLRYD